LSKSGNTARVTLTSQWCLCMYRQWKWLTKHISMSDMRARVHVWCVRGGGTLQWFLLYRLIYPHLADVSTELLEVYISAWYTCGVWGGLPAVWCIHKYVSVTSASASAVPSILKVLSVLFTPTCAHKQLCSLECGS
jgi:hypothetical protein